jgi:hypothetical protein
MFYFVCRVSRPASFRFHEFLAFAYSFAFDAVVPFHLLVIPVIPAALIRAVLLWMACR